MLRYFVRRTFTGGWLARGAVAGLLLVLAAGLMTSVTPTAQASQHPQVKVHPDYSGYEWSRIVWTGTETVIAGANESGDVSAWWQAPGSTTWNQEMVETSVYVRSVALAWTGSGLVIAAVSGSGIGLYVWEQPTGSSDWTYAPIATSGSYGLPSIAASGNAVMIADDDSQGNLYVFTQPLSSSGWTSQLVEAGGGPADNVWQSPSITTTGSSVVMTDIDNNDDLYFFWKPLGATYWESPQLVAAGSASSGHGSYYSPQIAVSSSAALIVADGYGGGIDFWYEPFGSPNWSTAAQLPGGGGVVGSPTIAWTGTGTVVTFSTSSSLLFDWNANGSPTWNVETIDTQPPGGGGSWIAPDITTTNSASVISVVDSTTNNVDYWYNQDDTSTWLEETVYTGTGTTGTGSITGYDDLCVDDRAGSTANLNPVQIYPCNGTAAQQWTQTLSDTLEALGKCMDIDGGGTANGTTVDLYDCNGTGAQVFVPEQDGTLYNPQSGKCLDDTNWSTTPGTQLQIWSCTGNANQQWNVSDLPG